jgi:putative oxidoreductase
MSTTGHPAPGEPRPIIPAFGAFYAWSRDLSYLVIRLTAGGMLLAHGVAKLMYGSVAIFATAGLARRGIEPCAGCALPLAYAVWTIETVGAICIMLGLFTRFFAVAAGIQFTVIVFIAHWPYGFWWNRPGGGWEYPLLWGLMFAAVALRGGGPYSLDRKIGWEL